MFLFDIAIFPVYVFIFYLYNKYRCKKMIDVRLVKYYKIGFWVRVLGCFAFTFFQMYISGGDSLGLYYTEGVHISKLLLSDISNWEKIIFTSSHNMDASLFGADGGGVIVFFDESNYMPARISGVLTILGLRSYLITNFFFSMFAFEGCWKLFQFFYQQRPFLHKEIAFGVLVFPTFIFWSSGIGKEAICIASIGFLSYYFWRLLKGMGNIFISFIYILIATFFLYTIKSYILYTYAPFLMFIGLFELKDKIKSVALDGILKITIPLVCIFAAIVLIYNPSTISDVLASDELAEKIQTQQNNFLLQDATSNFTLGITLTGSFQNLIQAIPFALAATFLRPFIWEVSSITSLISAIESLFLAYLFLKLFFTTGNRKIFSALSDRVFIFSIGFAILFGYFVGISTANFGSLVRYKIPCLPFFIIAISLLYYKKTNKSII